MDVITRHFGKVAVVAATGRVDQSSASALESALSPLWGSPDVASLVLDFSGIEYISSVGLRVLMVAAKALRARKAAIAVASLQPVVAEIFEISRFHHVVDVRGNLRDAIGAISPQALAAYDRTAERT